MGGNVLLTGGPNMGNTVRELIIEVGFEFDDDKTQVIDNHNFYSQLVTFFQLIFSRYLG